MQQLTPLAAYSDLAFDWSIVIDVFPDYSRPPAKGCDSRSYLSWYGTTL